MTGWVDQRVFSIRFLLLEALRQSECKVDLNIQLLLKGNSMKGKSHSQLGRVQPYKTSQIIVAGKKQNSSSRQFLFFQLCRLEWETIPFWYILRQFPEVTQWQMTQECSKAEKAQLH